MDSLEMLIDRRLRAIISGQRRACYGNVAALGEVKESWGDAGACSRILLGYRQAFPRHSAFREELRRYGMPEVRKGKRR